MKKWKSLSTSKKVSLIVSLVIWLILLVFVILVLFAGNIFGENSIFNQILGSDGNTFDLGKWFKDNLTKILATIFYIAVFIGGSKLIRFLLSLLFTKNKKAATIVKLLNSFIKYLSVIILILIVLGTWGVNTSTLLASAGILALIVGLGAQPLIADIIAGLFIVFDDDYQVGDIIVLDDFRGTVKEIGIRNTKITDSCGNVKIVNNIKIVSMINMSNNLSLALVDISIDYDEDLEKTEKLLNDNFNSFKAKIPEIKGKIEYLGVQELADSSVNLRFIAECDEEDKFHVMRALNREMYLLMKKNNINIPFNQLVISKRDNTK